MLPGRPPFDAPTPLDTLLQVVHLEPLPPCRLRPRLPRDLETIVLKCLQKEPRARFATALDLADDLKRFLAGEPIHSRPLSNVERAWRCCRRNPAVATLLTALALVFISGFALVTWKWRAEAAAVQQTQQEKQAADVARNDAERLAARMVMDQAVSQGDSGQIDRALLLFVQ